MQVTKVRAYVRMERVAAARGQHQAYLGERRGKQQHLNDRPKVEVTEVEIESELLDKTSPESILTDNAAKPLPRLFPDEYNLVLTR
jgi:hypothetical protein